MKADGYIRSKGCLCDSEYEIGSAQLSTNLPDLAATRPSARITGSSPPAEGPIMNTANSVVLYYNPHSRATGVRPVKKVAGNFCAGWLFMVRASNLRWWIGL
jgi:hypothetical protein